MDQSAWGREEPIDISGNGIANRPPMSSAGFDSFSLNPPMPVPEELYTHPYEPDQKSSQIAGSQLRVLSVPVCKPAPISYPGLVSVAPPENAIPHPGRLGTSFPTYTQVQSMGYPRMGESSSSIGSTPVYHATSSTGAGATYFEEAIPTTWAELSAVSEAFTPAAIDGSLQQPSTGPVPLGQSRASRPRRTPRRLTTKEEANFQCEVEGCGKLFSRSYNYKAHMETHDEKREYPFPCQVPDCNKKFVRKTDLQRHHQSVHVKERNHKCDYCGRLFARKDTLRRHMDDGCSKRFDIGTLDLRTGYGDPGALHQP